MPRRLLCSFAIAAVASTGCSSSAPVTNTSAPALSPDGFDWTCREQSQPTQPQATTPQTFTYTFQLVEWPTDNPLPGRKVEVCSSLDPSCSNVSLSTTQDFANETDISVPVSDGVRSIRLEADGYVPEVLYFDGPLTSDRVGGKMQMVTPSVLDQLGKQAGVPIDPTLGVLAIRAYDCAGKPVTNAIYTIDKKADPFTIVNGALDVSAVPSSSTEIPTDGSQWAGFLNVSPGYTFVNGMDAMSRQSFGDTVRSGTVPPGVISIIEFGAPAGQ